MSNEIKTMKITYGFNPEIGNGETPVLLKVEYAPVPPSVTSYLSKMIADGKDKLPQPSRRRYLR